MTDSDILRSARPAPEPVNRTTKRGADQYVLACNARRDASDLTFVNILRIEEDNRKQRAELAWKRQHAATRTRRWVRSRLVLVTYVFAVIAWAGGWFFSANGKEARVGMVSGWAEPRGEDPSDTFSKPHWLLAGMSRHEIDSLAAAGVRHRAQMVR
jgi:hypothetical protein